MSTSWEYKIIAMRPLFQVHLIHKLPSHTYTTAVRKFTGDLHNGTTEAHYVVSLPVTKTRVLHER